MGNNPYALTYGSAGPDAKSAGQSGQALADCHLYLMHATAGYRAALKRHAMNVSTCEKRPVIKPGKDLACCSEVDRAALGMMRVGPRMRDGQKPR